MLSAVGYLSCLDLMKPWLVDPGEALSDLRGDPIWPWSVHGRARWTHLNMAQSFLAALRKPRQYVVDTSTHFVHRSAMVCHPFAMSFAVSAEMRQNAAILTVHGDVDLATAPALESAIADVWIPPQSLVIDAGDVPFMDSTGLGVLVKAALRAREEGGRVAMAAVGSRVHKVLAITGLDEHVAIYSTVEEALRNT